MRTIVLLAFMAASMAVAACNTVEGAGRDVSAAGKAVTTALHAGSFDTIIGRLGFDAKGDVTGIETFRWYRWHHGELVPAEEIAAIR